MIEWGKIPPVDHLEDLKNESGTEPAKQINMGLYGALVVRPAMNIYDEVTGELLEAYAYNDPASRYKPENEYLLLITEIDPMLHVAEEQGYIYDMNNYKPRYHILLF